jgi:hypothetical protein
MRFMGLLDKGKFESFLSRCASGALESLQDELIAIDGKALRGTRR